MQGTNLPAHLLGNAEADFLFNNLTEHEVIAVAVSGGRDSMVLLRLLQRWSLNSDEPRPTITALTVDHGLRPGSAQDAVQVAKWCSELKTAHHTLLWEGDKPNTRIQERAREERYRLMTRWCKSNNAHVLLLAHHLWDQAETVLMRLSHASGVDGLAGMRSISMRDGIEIHRPLLAVPRMRLEATLKEFGQEWLDDPSNEDRSFERVRLRQAWPEMCNIGLDPTTIGASAAKLARASTALDSVADVIFGEIVTLGKAGEATLPTKQLASVPLEIVARVVKRLVEVISGSTPPGDRSLMRLCEDLIVSQDVSRTLRHCHFRVSDGLLVVVRENRDLPHHTLNPGTKFVWDNRFLVLLAHDSGPVDLTGLGQSGFAKARRMNPHLIGVPTRAGASLPGGFIEGELTAPPCFNERGNRNSLFITFMRKSIIINQGWQCAL
jgi:tRNA(Ile)-lysidine synthase